MNVNDKFYDGVINKPSLNDISIKHFNTYHDPKSGQFTTKSGIKGSNNIKSKKVKKTADDIKIENLEEDIKNNHIDSKPAKDFKNQQIKALKDLLNKKKK